MQSSVLLNKFLPQTSIDPTGPAKVACYIFVQASNTQIMQICLKESIKILNPLQAQLVIDFLYQQFHTIHQLCLNASIYMYIMMKSLY